MGRGRAKAKQTKVARELKYSTHGTDLDALRAELASDRPPERAVPPPGPAANGDSDDLYAKYADDEGSDD